MPLHRKATLALLLVLLIAWPATVLADDITISTNPGTDDVGPLRFTMPAEDSSASYVLYVRNDDSAEQQGLELLAFLEDADRHPTPSVEVDFLDTNDRPLGSFDLRANSQRRIVLQVDKLADHGVFTGTIVLQQTPVVTESVTSAATQEVLTQFTLDHPGQAKIRVLEADDQEDIVLTASGRDFTFPLTLIETQGQVAVSDLVVKVGGLTRQDGGPGEPATLTWSSEGETEGPLALPPKGYRSLTLKGDLPEATGYQGWLSLGYGDEVERYLLKITRSDAGRLSVLEAGADGAVELNVRGSDSKPGLTLQVADGQPAIDDLTVAIGELRRQDGQVLKDETLACSLCDGNQHRLAPGVAVPLTLSPAGLQPTTYLASLFLSYEGRSHAVPLTITRAELLNNVQVTKPATVRSVNWVLTPTEAQVPVSVEETSGLETTIYYPSAGDLQLTDPDQQVSSFSPDQVQVFLQEPTGELVPLPTPSADEHANPTLVLPANGNLDLVYRLKGLDAVGAYTGKVRVLGPDNSRVTQDFNVNVRHGFVYAFLAILGGVLLSYYWHNWRKEGRSRALLGRDIAETREEIEAVPDRLPEDLVWQSLLDRLERLERQNHSKTLALAAAQNTLKDLQNRQRLYLEAWAVYETLVGLLDSFPSEPDEVAQKADTYRQQGQDAFQAVQAALAGESGLGDGPKDAPAGIKTLKQVLDEARRKAIEAPAQAMKADLEELIAQASLSPSLQAQARSLKDRIDRLQDAVEPDEPDVAPYNHAALTEDLDQAREDYVDLRLKEMRARVSELEAGQDAVPNASWDTVRQLLDKVIEDAETSQAALAAGAIDTALRTWQEADNTLLGATVQQLAVLASPQGRPADIPASQWQALLDGATDLQSSLSAAQTQWEAGNYDEAYTAYGKAQEAFLGVQCRVLEQRIDAFQARMAKPEFVEVALWQDHVPESDLQQALADVKKSLSQAPSTPTDISQAHRAGRARFLEVQVEWLRGAYGALEAIQREGDDQIFELSGEWWTRRIPDQLQALDRALDSAQAHLKAYQASHGQDLAELGRAEAFGRDAQEAYRELLTCFAAAIKPAPASLDLESKRVQVQAAADYEPFGPMTTAPAAAPRVGAAVAYQPDSSQMAAISLVQVKEPHTSEEWDRYIRTNDRLVLWISLFLAAASGLSVLYLSNATFGTLGHYLTAFLWGFGIQAGTELATAGAPGVPKVGPALGLDTQ